MSIEDIESIIASFNAKAMTCLEGNNFNTALSLLHQAHFLLKNKKISQTIINLRCVTLNNLGCVYKRLERLKKALFYLHEALRLGNRYESSADMAGIHLNISAIRSLQCGHEEALFHALKALRIAQQLSEPKLDNAHTLLAGYFQAALEYQHLHKFSEALKYFKHGYELSCTHLGKNHITTIKFFKALHEKHLKFDIQALKAAQKRPQLQPLESRKGMHLRFRSEVKSTEPTNKNKPLQSYSSSPLKAHTRSKSDMESKITLISQSPISNNIKYINNVLVTIQKKLHKYNDKFLPGLYCSNRSDSNISTPSGLALKRNTAAIVLQKHLRMWRCRKKYKKTVEKIVRIQKAFRDWRYKEYRKREKFRICDFSQQFNKEIRQESLMKARELLKHIGVQKGLELRHGSVSHAVVQNGKPLKLYNQLALIQRNVRRYLAGRKKVRVMNAALKIQSFLRMALKKKKYKKIQWAIKWIQQTFRESKVKNELRAAGYENFMVKSKKEWR